MSVQRFRHCWFEIDEKVIWPEPVTRGLVVLNGPKATLYEWSAEDKRYNQLDRLEKVTKRETDDGLVIEGVSEVLKDLGHPPKAAKTAVNIVPRKNCASCG